MFLALGLTGCLSCGPAWHSPAPPRARSASAQRQGARGRARVLCHILRAGRAPPAGYGERVGASAGRLRAAGARPEKAGGSGAAPRPTRAPRPPPPVSCSPFSFSTPCARASSRSLNDAQVPPGAALFISLPPPKRDSPSSASVSSPLAARQGVWGEKATGFGERVSVTEFPITHSFGLFPESGQLPLPPSSGRAPAPREAAAVSESGGPHVVPGCRLPGANEGHFYQFFIGLDSGFLWQDARPFLHV